MNQWRALIVRLVLVALTVYATFLAFAALLLVLTR